MSRSDDQRNDGPNLGPNEPGRRTLYSGIYEVTKMRFGIVQKIHLIRVSSSEKDTIVMVVTIVAINHQQIIIKTQLIHQ